MSWSRIVIALLILAAWAGPVSAQVRARPRSAEGGEAQGEPWAEVPEAYRHMSLPDWPVPTDLGRWQKADRPRTRAVLLKLLGEMPPRPDPAKVEVVAREEHDGYTLERFRFHNGVDAVVPGILLLPKGRKGPAPAVVGLSLFFIDYAARIEGDDDGVIIWRDHIAELVIGPCLAALFVAIMAVLFIAIFTHFVFYSVL